MADIGKWRPLPVINTFIQGSEIKVRLRASIEGVGGSPQNQEQGEAYRFPFYGKLHRERGIDNEL